MSYEMCSWQKETDDATLAEPESEWEESMAMPMLGLAEQYDRILQSLGFETQEPAQVADGWVVKWRP